MRALALFLAGLAAAAQNPEAGRIERTGDESRLIVDHSPRPVDSAAITLAEQFGILVNVEDPLPGILASPGQSLEVSFRTNPDGRPQDARMLVEDLRTQANSRLGLSYRLDENDGMQTLVGTRTGAIAVLDRRISIPGAMRTVIEHAHLMSQELSKQTGARIDCCQALIAGVPWGLEKIWYSAQDEPARDVLIHLIHATRGHYYWLLRCEPSGVFCFLNVRIAR
jgi:hypothetical protein